MICPPFLYHRPTTVDEALNLLSRDPEAVVLAGGQTLINALKLDLVGPTALVDIHRLDDLREVSAHGGAIHIGAAVTYAELARSEVIRQQLPILAAVSSRLVDRQVRNRGTVGGNCCLNEPASNFPPLFAALEATFFISQDGQPARQLDATEFFCGTLMTAARAPAMLTRISLPVEKLPGRSAQVLVSYQHQLIGADSWALARAVLAVKHHHKRVTSARAFIGAVPNSPMRLPGVEAVLVGSSIAPGTIESALAAFDDMQVAAIGDSHGSADYRLALARVQLKRALVDTAHNLRMAPQW